MSYPGTAGARSDTKLRCARRPCANSDANERLSASASCPSPAASASSADTTVGSPIAGPLATTRPTIPPPQRISRTRTSSAATCASRPDSTDAPTGTPEASNTATRSRSAAGANEARIRPTRTGSSAAPKSVMADRAVVSDRGDRGGAIGMRHEQPVQPGPREYASHGRLGPAELDLGLAVATFDSAAHRVEGRPAALEVRRFLAMHHEHDRVERHEP